MTERIELIVSAAELAYEASVLELDALGDCNDYGVLFL